MLGGGVMGVVYLAHDLELDRDVALKRVRRTDDPAAEEALRGEAQALARLSHPNVVAVHQVAEDDEGLRIVMEYVQGRTLLSWVADEEPHWLRAIEVMLGAGRGLSAAHSVGVVHRDFKPSNVMVDDAGWAKVVDFGLASLRKDAQKVIAGTPRYMAPEQRAGTADARSDQYAFAVTLHEVLFGTPSGESAVRSPRAQGRPPGWIKNIIEKATREDPAERYSTLDALLADIQRRLHGRRRRAWLLGTSLAVLFAGGVSAAIATLIGGAAAICDGAEMRMSEVWDTAKRDAAQKQFTAVAGADGAMRFKRVAEALDAYAASWSRAHRAACEATRVAQTQSEDLLDHQMRCLDRARVELRSLVDAFGRADAAAVPRAVGAVQSLPLISSCADLQSVALSPRPNTPEARHEVEAIQELLSQARAAERLGNPRDALSLAERALVRARQLAYPPTAAEALHQVGVLHFASGAHAEAARVLKEAIHQAELGEHDEVRAAAAVAMMSVLGPGLGQFDSAEQWRLAADGVMARMGERAPLQLRLRHLNESGRLFEARGELERAEQAHRRALQLAEQRLSPDDHRIASTLYYLATIDPDPDEETLRLATRAAGILERDLGPDHPRMATMIGERCRILLALGRADEALTACTRSHSLLMRTFGAQYPDLAVYLSGIAQAQLALGRAGDAAQAVREASEIARLAWGDEDRDVAGLMLLEARTEVARRRLREARLIVDRAWTTLDRAIAKDHPLWIEAHVVKAEVLRASGRSREAAALEEEATRRGHMNLKRDAIVTASAWLGLARSRKMLRDHRGAVDALETALKTLETCSSRPDLRAEVELELAQTLLRDRRELARVDELSRRAQGRFGELGVVGDKGRAAAEQLNRKVRALRGATALSTDAAQ